MPSLTCPTIPKVPQTDTTHKDSSNEYESDFQIDPDLYTSHTQENIEIAREVRVLMFGGVI